MIHLKRNQASRLQLMRAYLIFILACTFLLFCFNIISFYREREELHRLAHLQSLQAGQLLHPPINTPDSELAFIALSTFTFISIMAVVIHLLIHVSWDIRWYHLRSNFVSGVSHDFKTPLSLVRLYSETLAKHDEDFSPEERKKYTRIITRESARMSRLVDNVLSFSRVEQDKQKTPILELGNIGDLLEEVMEEYSEYLAWQGFEIVLSVQPRLPLIRFSREGLAQTVLNLIENAVKYSGASKIIRITSWAKGGDVYIEVQDYGIGISPEEQQQVFLPFYRASKGTEKGGCGLGLYLVDQVMKEHNGRIELESEVDKGSRFRLVFPIEGYKEFHTKRKRFSSLAAFTRGLFIRAQDTHR